MLVLIVYYCWHHGGNLLYIGIISFVLSGRGFSQDVLGKLRGRNGTASAAVAK